MIGSAGKRVGLFAITMGTNQPSFANAAKFFGSLLKWISPEHFSASF